MENKEEGQVLLINKPYEWTSFGVVKKIRNQLGLKKVGHAGTLDPLATGLLILCTGKKTKQIESYQSLEKEYIGKMIIGKTTPSFDLETEFDSETDWRQVTEKDILEAAKLFKGKIEQTPPQFSAVKVNGKKAYDLARAGKKAEIKPRKIFIYEFKINNIVLPEISFEMVCSKGTYVRSIVDEFGKAIGVGAYLAELCRTRIGEHNLSDALSIEEACALK